MGRSVACKSYCSGARTDLERKQKMVFKGMDLESDCLGLDSDFVIPSHVIVT